MSAKVIGVLVLSAAVAAGGHASGGTLVNGSFETGTLSGWTARGGTWSGSPTPPVDPSTYSGAANAISVVGVGTDPYTNLSTVYHGSYAAKLNDNIQNYSVNLLRQSVANYTDPDIYFVWQAVLQGSHGLNDSDYFSLTLRDDTTGTPVVSRAYSSAGPIGNGTSGITWTNYGGVYSAGWVVEHVDIAGLGLLGHDFTLEVLASDCPYGGHWGYVYLDGFGAAVPPSNVPEIDFVCGPNAIAFLCGSLAMIVERSRFRRR